MVPTIRRQCADAWKTSAETDAAVARGLSASGICPALGRLRPLPGVILGGGFMRCLPQRAVRQTGGQRARSLAAPHSRSSGLGVVRAVATAGAERRPPVLVSRWRRRSPRRGHSARAADRLSPRVGVRRGRAGRHFCRTGRRGSLCRASLQLLLGKRRAGHDAGASRCSGPGSTRSTGRVLRDLRPAALDHALLPVPLDGTPGARRRVLAPAARAGGPLRSLPRAGPAACRGSGVRSPGASHCRHQESGTSAGRQAARILRRLPQAAGVCRAGDRLERSLERTAPARLSLAERLHAARRPAPRMHALPRSAWSAVGGGRSRHPTLHRVPRERSAAGVGLPPGCRPDVLVLPHAPGEAAGRTAVHKPLDRRVRPRKSLAAARGSSASSSIRRPGPFH